MSNEISIPWKWVAGTFLSILLILAGGATSHFLSENSDKIADVKAVTVRHAARIGTMEQTVAGHGVPGLKTSHTMLMQKVSDLSSALAAANARISELERKAVVIEQSRWFRRAYSKHMMTIRKSK